MLIQCHKTSDKNSLFDRGRIVEMALCVKKNKSQYLRVLGYPVSRRILGIRLVDWMEI